MIPILFSENSNTFTTNGIGRLSDAISCVVTEERNGQFELAMVYPADGKHFEDITLRALIVADASPAQTKQPFRIYKISKPINGKVTINAQHISYDLSKNVSMPFSVSASTSACASALSGLKTNAVEDCPFTFSTNVTTVASFAQLAPATIRQMMGGVEGSVLDQFGGEYKFDKFAVSLLVSRGTTKNIPLRYGKNITDIKQEENIANTITGIVPFWSDSEGGDVYTLPEKVLHSSNAGSYSSYLTVPIDFSSDFEEKPTESQLRAHGQVYINKYGIGIPKVSIDVSFVNLPDTEEYKGLLNLQQLELCDTIPVEFVKLGISASAKVVKTEYNTLKDRYDRITVGEVGTTLAKTITGVSDSVTGLADTTKTNFAKVGHEVDAKINTATANFPTRQDVQYEIDNATAWITATGGIIRALKNSDDEWTDLLCCSANATASTGNVLRFNVNGIGFSSTGWNGPFTQAWTLDGRMVIGGTNVPSLTVYDNNLNVIFQVDATKMIWNATNSSMDATGTITANNAVLSNATINDGTITLKHTTSSGHLQEINISPWIQSIDFFVDNNLGARITPESDIDGGLMLSGKNYLTIGETDDVIMNPVPTPANRSSDIRMIIGAKGDAVFGSSDNSAYIGASDDITLITENYDINLNSARGIILDSSNIQVPDGSSFISGYTGTRNLGNYSVRFINGICVSIS